MASGMMRCIIDNLLEDKEGDQNTSKYPRTKDFFDYGTLLLQKAIENNDYIDAFDEFSERMVKALNNLIKSGPVYRSLSAKREIMWSSFHLFRLSSDYCKIWEDLLKKLNLQIQDRLFHQ